MTNANTNVDYAEIQKFTALADKWWDKSGPFKPLHDINPLRLDWIEKACLAQFGSGLGGKKIVDVGCGGGILSYAMASKGASVLGVDLGAENLSAGRLHAERMKMDNLQFECIPVENLAERESGQYDVVTCMEMIEHVPDPASVIRACQALLKPNGILIASTINRNPKAYLFAIIGAEYVLKLLDKGTHDYHKFVTPAELDKMGTNANLIRTDMIGLHYNPLTKRYWLADNVDVNYMMAFKSNGN